MYCSSCGAALVQGLSYCNYCGAKLSREKGHSAAKSSEVKAEILIAAMVAVFVLGFAAITLLMGMMKSVLNLNVGLIFALLLLPFLLMLVLEGVFMRLLLRRTRSAGERGDAALLKEQATNELDRAQARALPEPVPSVTEHTTRSFETLYGERKSK